MYALFDHRRRHLRHMHGRRVAVRLEVPFCRLARGNGAMWAVDACRFRARGFDRGGMGRGKGENSVFSAALRQRSGGEYQRPERKENGKHGEWESVAASIHA